MPIVGAVGAPGNATIITFADASEMHPDSLVTVKLYDPVASPGISMLIPVPVIAPGLTVQLPFGNPLRMTLPVATPQVGCVIVPTTGADGAPGKALITTLDEGAEIHPAPLVTV